MSEIKQNIKIINIKHSGLIDSRSNDADEAVDIFEEDCEFTYEVLLCPNKKRIDIYLELILSIPYEKKGDNINEPYYWEDKTVRLDFDDFDVSDIAAAYMSAISLMGFAEGDSMFNHKLIADMCTYEIKLDYEL